MTLSMAQLQAYFASFHPQCCGTDTDLITVYSVCCAQSVPAFPSLDFLYLGYVSAFPEAFLHTPHISAVLIEDVPLPEIFLTRRTFLRLPPDTILPAAFEHLGRLFRNISEETAFRDNLSQAALHGSGLQKLCDLAMTFIQNPIVVLDNSMKHIAESYADVPDDEIWITQKKNGSYIPEEYLRVLLDQTERQHGPDSFSPVILPKEGLKYRRMIIPIYSDRRPAGTIVILESARDFQEQDLHYGSILSEILALQMNQDSFLISSKDMALEHLFQDLLHENIPSAVFQDRIRAFHLDQPSGLYVLAADISSLDSAGRTLQYYRHALGDILSHTVSFSYDNYIVLICFCPKGSFLTAAEQNSLSSFCTKRHFSIGISRCFEDLFSLKTYYEQAVQALRLSPGHSPDTPLLFYADLVIRHMLSIVSENHDLKQFCESSLLALLAHDTQSHTDYVNCLFTYLQQERSIAHTADCLHLHKNTLLYRLHKIEEILGQSLDDPDYRFRLLFTYQILSAASFLPDQSSF